MLAMICLEEGIVASSPEFSKAFNKEWGKLGMTFYPWDQNNDNQDTSTSLSALYNRWHSYTKHTLGILKTVLTPYKNKRVMAQFELSFTS